MRRTARSRIYGGGYPVRDACPPQLSSFSYKHTDLEVDQENTRRKNEELSKALRQKTQKQLHTQELYDKLKRQALLNQVQNAAMDAVDENIQASVTASRYADAIQNQNMHPPPPPAFPNLQSTSMRRTASYPANMGPPLPPHPNHGLTNSNWGAEFGGPPSSRTSHFSLSPNLTT